MHKAFGAQVPRGYQGRFDIRRDLLPALGTFHLVAFSWIFFRADSFSNAIAYLGGLLRLRLAIPDLNTFILVTAAIFLIGVIDFAQRNSGQHEVMLRWRPSWQGLAYAAGLLAIVIFSGGPVTPFIYFQF